VVYGQADDPALGDGYGNKVMPTGKATELLMEARYSPYTKVNDGGDLHPDKDDGYLPDQEPEGVVWIASRPSPVLVAKDTYSYLPWVEIVSEAHDRVYLLVQKGHARARAVIDLHYEMALTCDNCGLWSAIGHRTRRDKFSSEYETGELLAAESCDPRAVHKLFGKEFDPASAFDREHAVDYGEDSSQARRGASNAATTKKRRS
jgi:hypothetical protein